VHRIVDLYIYVACLIGLVASVWLIVLGLAVMPGPLNGYGVALAKGTLLSVFGVGVPFVLRWQQLTVDTTLRKVGKAQYRGCPRWMRLTCYGLMAAGAVLFFLPLVLESTAVTPPSDGSAIPSTLAGGFGLMAYSSIFAQLYSLKALSGSMSKRSRDTIFGD
jgi:hypothetical protein